MALKLIGAIAVISILGVFLTHHTTNACNEVICASIVSKCMLTQSCKCDLKNCSCCKECYNCLNYLYSECCSCVEMCPKPNETKNALSAKSLVDELDGIPGLFQALTVEQDIEKRWLSFSFPVDFAEALFKEPVFNVIDNPDQDLEKIMKLQSAKENVVTVNCTVAYLSQCMSWGKCKSHCNHMGATSVRYGIRSPSLNPTYIVFLCFQVVP